MGKNEGKAGGTNSSKWGPASTMFKTHRTLWLAGLLAFFVPSMAASAWYAGSTIGTNQANGSLNTEELVSSADAAGATATSSSDGTSASARASAGSTTAASSAGGNDPQVRTEVTVNGQKIPVPNTNSGGQTSTTVQSNGTTSQVSISVNSDQANSGSSSGFSSTHIHSNSSTNSNSNNLNSNTYYNSNTVSSP
jgi:hypothetical protein